MTSQLAGLDWILIALYFVVIFAGALWATVRERRDHRQETSADYFLAGRNAGWFIVGASLFASNIGSEHLVGLAGTGAESGVAVAQFEILASFFLLLLGWVFVPFYLRSGVFTMPEFLERRYSPAARWYLAGISILGYVLTKISVTIFAGGIVFVALMGIDFWTGALVVVVATGIYTVVGGLRAVLVTDAIQMVVLLGGAIAVTAIGLNAVGGWGELVAAVPPGFLDLWKPASDPNFPWTGILFGAPILGIWYWCTDQFIVQRVLSARDLSQARRATVFAGLLKQLPLFIFVIPGVIAYVLVQQGRLELGSSDQALPALIGTLLPVGLRGIVVAGLLAALMSSLSSVFNSTSTLITWDIYRELRPNASEQRLVWVGRISTAVLVAFGLLWIPLMQLISGTLYVYLQSVQAYIAPPIAAVFLLGVFFKRLNAHGAIASLLTGFVLGMGRLVAELNKGSLDGWLFGYADINFLHFAALLFLVCVAVLVGVSMATPPPPAHQIAGLTYQTTEPAPAEGAVPARARRLDLALTAAVLAVIAVLWVWFSA
ncbi:MAG TPA: sodium:solute symporter [Longimicrobiales bacterium]|nr:sodium:solute symporter [Longimicrobiales bacterium]